MKTFILDSSAVLRFTDDEVGADRVAEILRGCSALVLHRLRRPAVDETGQFAFLFVLLYLRICFLSEVECRVSALQWGEIVGKLHKRLGFHQYQQIAQNFKRTKLSIVSIDSQRAERAAAIRVDYKLGSADSYAAELTLDSPESVLVTADYDFKAVEDLIRIEFLPAK